MHSILLSTGWPIWPLLIISVVGLAIVIERSWYLRREHMFPKGCLESAFTLANQLASQKSLAMEQIATLAQQSPATPLLACALREKVDGSSTQSAIEELQAVAQVTWLKFDRYLGVLATIATVAPLLGLFGTVVGMIEIFGGQGVIHGAGNPQQLAHGISVALYNTAVGLLNCHPCSSCLACFAGNRQPTSTRV